MLASLLKPEYLFRPRQLAKRLLQGKQSGFKEVELPWGTQIRVSAEDNVGGQIATLGLYDLVITETLWRLCEKGETAVDVGANIGYTALVMAQRIGNVELTCFEPHPTLFQELSHNIQSLQSRGSETQFRLISKALGPIAGELPLFVPKDFNYHRGESSLAVPSHLECDEESIMVPVVTLESQFSNTSKIGVMKMDVEGFELEVLRGAESVFASHRVRDCVFEEHNTYPTPVSDWFEKHGYQIFRLDRSFFRPLLLPPDSPIPRTNWTATNYLATINPKRCEERFAANGWQCLRG